MASPYGDITKVETTGASDKTAKQCHSSAGVEASHKLANEDLERMKTYKDIIFRAGCDKQIDPAVIAGIISRESRAGAALKDGWGDHGNAFGLMQIDKRYHRIKGEWNSETHLSDGTQILVDFIKVIQRKFPTWPKEHQLKGGISAYNAGDRNVRTYDKMDIGTTGDDYANDVVARAQWYKKNGF
ncbi:lysozyme g-like 1 [Erpetoichthys calabaricus]|uniref:Lysozyme g n=1 Tax=Erpetoichthys calabaricus TaxID=27687 RepID=A0A8C4SN03_ERPCA|nr:lysozyme g-like 1 [Erpetoichthys calabaricus]